MVKFDFSGRVAVVTGASSGLGVCFARALAEQGADLAILARRTERLEAVAAEIRELGVRCLPVTCDISNEEAVCAAVNTIVGEYGRIDVLVNNAGLAEYNSLLEFTTEQWNNVIACDLTGVFLLTREVARIFESQSYGRVVNISSMAGVLGGNHEIAYYAAKGGVINMTRAMASELARYGVLVNCLAPGGIITEMSESMLDSAPAEKLRNRTMLRRFAAPEELCAQMLLFASEENTYCTGQTIVIDGGLTSRL